MEDINIKKDKSSIVKKVYLIIVSLLIGAILTVLVLLLTNMFKDDFDEELVAGSIIWKNDLICEVLISTSQEDVGKIITITGLDSEKVKIVYQYEENSFSNNFEKYIDISTVVKIRYLGDASDEIVINKYTGEFARAGSGFVSGVYSFAQKGICK